MKKLKLSLLPLALLLLLPLTTVLSGCGATPKNEALGVNFVSYDYDDSSGYAIFEVDYNTPTKLEFKVNPSTWSGYAVTYAIKECSGQNRSRFKLQDGIITIESYDFEEIKVEIFVHGYSDVCIVRLKQYPTSIYVKNTDVTIAAGGSYTINPIGRFVDAFGKTYEKPLLEYSYNFLVETEDETIINVPNKNRLKVVSVRSNNASTKVYITLLNTNGESYGEKFKLTLNFKVVENAGESRTEISGVNEFVKNGDKVTINASDLTKNGELYVISYKNYIFSAQKLLIEQENVSIECTISDARYVEVDDENATMLIQKGRDSSLKFNVCMWSNLTTTSGTVFVSAFEITINF